MRKRGLLLDGAALALLLVLAVAFFGRVTLGGKTLLPADNVFAWEPWLSYAAEAGISAPYNGLLSDLYIENYAWKQLIVEAVRARELPLWNPYILSGVPFLAAGQHSALYPFSILFYVLPLAAAFGWFAALHLFLGGAFTYMLARTLRVGRIGSSLAAVTFMFAGFTVTHNVFPMIIAGVVWLPLILVAIERIVRRAQAQHSGEQGGGSVVAHIPDLLLGSLATGMVFLAGHPEMYYYVALTAGAYALWRLTALAWGTRAVGTVLKTGATLLALAVLGFGLGAAQWLPLLELVRTNFREGAASLQDVLGWAYPPRRLIALLIPDFFGNPAHHSYLDLFTGRTTPVTVNALGEPIDSIYWGIKNYVEGASYVGVLPALLALIGLLCGGRRQRASGAPRGFFGLLALVSLLLVFGTPLYALVYALPGLSQVHSPFRWVMPYTLSMAILAGMGADVFARASRSGVAGAQDVTGLRARAGVWAERLGRQVLPWLSTAAGALGLLALGASLLVKERVAALAERAVQALALAPLAFADGRMFYSYQFRNLAIFAAALLFGGLSLLLRPRFRTARRWALLPGAVIVAELFISGLPFFPANDTALVGYRTPAIDYLQSDTSLFRVTTLVGGSEKTLNANTPMLYGLSDIRGYDSIIPRQYVETMRLISEQSELPYNRIAPLFAHQMEALDAPLLDAMNVKYVITARERAISNPGYALAYDGEVRIYRNEQALPRAWLVPQGTFIADAEARNQALRTFDPQETAILEEAPRQEPADAAALSYIGSVSAIDYTLNEVTLTLEARIPCLLVLSDSYNPDWLAYIRPPDAPEPQNAEQALHIYRANGNARAVEVPAGRWVVRFKYSPNAVKYGLYVSFVAAMTLLLAGGLWVWLRRFRRVQEAGDAQRVSRNTLAPITLMLINKLLDMAFAMLMLRVLSPADAGQYYFAVLVISWFDILTGFGLNALMTRDIARDRSQANRYLTNAIVLRSVLCVLTVPALAAFALARGLTNPIEPRTLLAIAMFGLALLPSNVAASYSAVFSAWERMELPAAVTTLSTLLKVAFGTLALGLGTGYVGLGVVSIVVSVITAVVLHVLLRRTLFRPRVAFDVALQRAMLRDSWPLMLNNLLATLFFKVAVQLLDVEALVADKRVLGYYSTAYKYVDAVNIIPSAFTLAIFPLMARYAANARGSLLKAYSLAIKLLLVIALPLALAGWAAARPLIQLLGGAEYLPQGAEILKVMVWYMPVGFINSVTQYVLISLDQQRLLTRAFVIGLTFNLLANLIGLSRYGWMASAYVTVISELVLFVPFYLGVRRHLAPMPWLRLVWTQVLSAAPLALLLILFPQHRALGLLIGLALYAAGVVLLRTFDADERRALGDVLPVRRLAARLVAKVRGA